MNQKNLKIAIEGNIASGKSTIIEYLKTKIDLSLNQSNKYNLEVIPEPINLWRNLNGNNLLDLMYNDLNKWAFPFNVYAQLTLLDNHLKMNQSQNNIYLMERSLYSARYCFIENFKKTNMIHSAEYEILDKWFDWITKSNDCSLDLIFYLRTSPEVCYERVMTRGRPEEVNSISLDYLNTLHSFHEEWLHKNENYNFYRPKSVIIIDANESIDNVYKTVENETKNAVFVKYN